MAVKRALKNAAQRNRQQQQHRPTHSTTVSIIGSGRLGTALARALFACGYEIEAVVARNATHARRAAKLSGTQPLALTLRQLGQLPASRLLFITTPDDAIAVVSAQLAATMPAQQRGRIALHASGALSSEALSDLKAAGFATGSLHPLVSVSEPLQGAESLRTAFYCVEGERAAARLARKIVRDLGARSFSVNTKDKALYHAAAVMASGHVTALFDIAAEMLTECGLTPHRARAVLVPLVRSTIENLAAHEPARALTGTFARADVTTVQNHLDALRRLSSREMLEAYALLGQRSLQLAKKNGADSRALKEIARRLGEAARANKKA